MRPGAIVVVQLPNSDEFVALILAILGLVGALNEAAVYRTVTMADGGAAVVAITAVRSAAAAPDPQQQADRLQQQAIREGTGDVLAYMSEVRRSADVRKNPKAFE